MMASALSDYVSSEWFTEEQYVGRTGRRETRMKCKPKIFA
jgi:hypothetical protein